MVREVRTGGTGGVREMGKAEGRRAGADAGGDGAAPDETCPAAGEGKDRGGGV
jgi:hypothetical protein